uniref:Y1 n=1 Tax=Arundo donax TaxID=35708 RepID=A0A0A9I2S6_ARUDO
MEKFHEEADQEGQDVFLRRQREGLLSYHRLADCQYGPHYYCTGKSSMRLKQMTTITSQRGLMLVKGRNC